MRKALMLIAAVGAFLALTAARPGNEAQLIQQLNGQPSRPVMPDGGAWGVFTIFDGGPLNNFACAPLTGLVNNVGGAISANVLLLSPLSQYNVCVQPSINGPLWDGGCNTIPTDPNYGVPLQAIPQYVTPDSAARTICAVSDAGSIQMPLWWAQ